VKAFTHVIIESAEFVLFTCVATRRVYYTRMSSNYSEFTFVVHDFSGFLLYLY